LPPEGRLCAAAPRMTLDWARERFGAEAAGRAVAHVELLHGIDLPAALKGNRVSLTLHFSLLEGLAAQGVTTHHFQDLGRYTATRVEEVMPASRLLLKVATPAQLVRAAPLLWKTYADVGVLEGEAHGSHGTLRLTGVPVASHAFCATLQGLFAGLLQRAGVQNPLVTHPACACEGGHECRFEGRWG
ncbi:MAG TPA: hypothetical protein VNZ52_11910, partial [Candidatus Thermoplasmatota archaeon]|nr:hypothetical protein [Candidatus Thermoplasmatota archaeon]